MKNHKKVKLKQILKKDLKQIRIWKNNKKLCNTIMAQQKNHSTNDVEQWYKEATNSKSQILLGIYTIKENKIIGIIRLMFIDWKSGVAELGMYIGNQSLRNKGYGKEALTSLIDLAFNHINLRKVFLKVLDTNTNAIKLYKSLGFKKEGVLKEHFIINEKLHDVIIMALIKK